MFEMIAKFMYMYYICTYIYIYLVSKFNALSLWLVGFCTQLKLPFSEDDPDTLVRVRAIMVAIHAPYVCWFKLVEPWPILD